MPEEITKATYEEIKTTLVRLASEYSSYVNVEVIGKSAKDKDILMACVTDRSLPDEDKEIVLITAGHHAGEHGGRWVVMALLEWLLTEESVEIRKKQVVLIIPFVNVDYLPYKSAPGNNYDPEQEPSDPQSKSVWDVVQKDQPDVVVDSHAFGGYTNECTLTHPRNEPSWDAYVHEVIAQEMNSASEREGYPVRTDTGRVADKNVGGASYSRFHSLCFVMEVNQVTYDKDDTIKSGLARLKELLKTGNRKWRGENYSGYPNRIIAKVDNVQLVACGSPAEERRKNRVKLWNNRRNIVLKEIYPVQRDCIMVYAEYVNGAALRFKLPRAVEVKEVSVNARIIQPSPKGGYVTWKESLSTYVEIDLCQQELDVSTLKGVCVSTVKFEKE